MFFRLKNNTLKQLYSEVTLIIKTFKRDNAIEKLHNSIRKKYNNIKVLIEDDGVENSFVESENYLDDSNTIRYYIDYDQGLSAGRNFLLDKVKTKYFILLDDDFVFCRKTKLEKLLQAIENNNVDIVGGRITEKGNYLHYEHQLILKDGVLTYKPEPISHDGSFYRYDIVLNFFIGNTQSVINAGGWDNRLKLQEHTEFFLRMKNKGLKVGYLPSVVIKHERVENVEYKEYRKRNFEKIWHEEYGVKEVIRK